MTTPTADKPAPYRPSYPGRLVGEARTLAAGGWTAGKIRAIWLEEGLDPCPSKVTIHDWIDEEYAERRRARDRRRHLATDRAIAAARGNFTLRGRGVEYEQAFVARLSEAGVPATSIAKVANIVLPRKRGWTHERVIKLLAAAAAGDTT